MDIYATKRAAKECGKKWQMKREVIPILITPTSKKRKLEKIK